MLLWAVEIIDPAENRYAARGENPHEAYSEALREAGFIVQSKWFTRSPEILSIIQELITFQGDETLRESATRIASCTQAPCSSLFSDGRKTSMKIAVYPLTTKMGKPRRRIVLALTASEIHATGFHNTDRLDISFIKSTNLYHVEKNSDLTAPLVWSDKHRGWTGNVSEPMQPTGATDIEDALITEHSISFTYKPISIRDVGAARRRETLRSRKSFNSHAEKLATFHTACASVLSLSRELNISIRFHPDIGFYTPLGEHSDKG